MFRGPRHDAISTRLRHVLTGRDMTLQDLTYDAHDPIVTARSIEAVIQGINPWTDDLINRITRTLDIDPEDISAPDLAPIDLEAVIEFGAA